MTNCKAFQHKDCINSCVFCDFEAQTFCIIHHHFCRDITDHTAFFTLANY